MEIEDEDLYFLKDDFLALNETKEIPKNKAEKGFWNVLIVDDDVEIHTITKLVLDDCEFDNKRLNFISAYSEKEAEEILQSMDDIAVILLDIVMESEDSGLRIVKYIREELENDIVRIVLRTGQPGQAPEKKIITDYDINDYREKTELTSQKLFTTIISSLRSFKELSTIYSNQLGLKRVVEASSSFFKFQSIEDFAMEFLGQIQYILGLDKDHVISGFAATKRDEEFIIIAATNKYEKYIDKKINDINSDFKTEEILEMGISNKIIFTENRIIAYFQSDERFENLIYLDGVAYLDNFMKKLMNICYKNISVAFDNIYMKEEMENTEREILFTLGEVAEARSKETSHHVKRVGEYSYLLALKYGLSKYQAELLRKASAMHDIGKLAIPDNILNKPGKLTDEEFGIMKTHSSVGKEILKNSNREIIKAGSIIAYQHHEKYNGKGYPLGLKGEEIHIYGRITAIADVFDALGSDRVYKKAWELDRIIELFKEESGSHFDPVLVEIFLENLDDILTIKNRFKDE